MTKKVKLAVVTTLICDDDSIYLIDPGQASIFLSGDRVEIDESGEPVLLRRVDGVVWARAKRAR